MTTTAPATTEARTGRRHDLMLAAFRVVVSFLFFCHGLQGLGFLGGIDGQGTGVPLGSFPGWWGSVIELVGALLVALGITARAAALVCSGAMAFAYFVVHQPTGLLPLHNMGELAALYCWAFLLIAVVGPGSYTVGRALRR
ncbi:DoxX family protein [Actinosynnema sp. NPDC047251]|uniref:DoxX family protein n=1 Tax=Saccharothrix espanaensis (strain ATCC 51144 / DSM 44229 / JCM 9112 / NBRC 15066 / NRRL 15764) TaxID=1179773 RepID=K0KDQ5_SACES|nr:DoxX family protein [Saccharothrix espanaensis]CCH34653.1 hypothetical protein BN6_74240 [Saccharothrix espanaensis DSM 44229]